MKEEEVMILEDNGDNVETIVKLRKLIKADPGNNFYRSVLEQYEKKGFMSARQIECIEEDYEGLNEFEWFQPS